MGIFHGGHVGESKRGLAARVFESIIHGHVPLRWERTQDQKEVKSMTPVFGDANRGKAAKYFGGPFRPRETTWPAINMQSKHI